MCTRARVHVCVQSSARGCGGLQLSGRQAGRHVQYHAPADSDAVCRMPLLLQELQGVWAYIKWEVAGCPNRSQQEADAEYQMACKVRDFVCICVCGGEVSDGM
jgi:hypothetical protein